MSKSTTQDAIFAEIERQVKAIEANGVQPTPAAALVKNLATAYRLVAGGQQPGGSVVTS